MWNGYPDPACYRGAPEKDVRNITLIYSIMIRVNVFIRVDVKDRDAVVADARKLVEASLNDDGCIAYDIFGSETREDVLMICETWRDEAALAAHEKADHFVTLVPKIQGLAEMKIEKFDF